MSQTTRSAVSRIARAAKAAHRAAIESPPKNRPRPGYTIDELARVAGSTVRNVRAYQDRGLLSPPERRGRVGIYTEAHLGRLRLINQMLGRGYTLANINEMFEALEAGLDLRQLLGLEQAISSPWTDEEPRHFSLPELLGMFSMPFHPRTLAKVIELGLLEPDGLGYRAPSPKILKAGAELTKLGMKLDDLLMIVEKLRANVERVADEMVQLVARALDLDGEAKVPTREDVPRLVELIVRLRPVADMAIDAEVSRALERSAQKLLGDRLAEVMDSLTAKSGRRG